MKRNLGHLLEDMAKRDLQRIAAEREAMLAKTQPMKPVDPDQTELYIPPTESGWHEPIKGQGK